MECGGWRFPEERLVFAGEPPELPKAVLGGDLCHAHCAGSAVTKGPPREMHPAQQQISFGAHPQLLLAAEPQCPVRSPDCRAQLRYVKRLIGLRLLHRPAKPAQDHRAVPLGRPVLANRPLSETIQQGLDQRLLETAGEG